MQRGKKRENAVYISGYGNCIQVCLATLTSGLDTHGQNIAVERQLCGVNRAISIICQTAA